MKGRRTIQISAEPTQPESLLSDLAGLDISFDGSEVRVDGAAASPLGVFPAHHRKSPLRIRRVSKFTVDDRWIPSAHYQLQVMAAAELQYPSATHVEFALYERDAQLVVLLE